MYDVVGVFEDFEDFSGYLFGSGWYVGVGYEAYGFGGVFCQFGEGLRCYGGHLFVLWVVIIGFRV